MKSWDRVQSLLNRVPKKAGAFAEKNHRLFLPFYLIVFFVSLAWMLYRIHFGIDFTDEAYYAAFSWVYELGSRPFVEEINFHHTLGLLLWPLVKIFRLFTDGPDGIILYFRYMFVLISGVCALAIFTELKKKVPEFLSFFFALSVFLYVPLSIPSPSYNNLGVILSILALVLSQNSSKPAQLTSGILSVVATLAYPSLVAPFVVWTVLRLLTKKDLKSTAFYIAGLAFASAVACSLFLYIGIANIVESLQANKTLNLQAPPVEKLLQLFAEMSEPLIRRVPILILSLCLIWKRKFLEFFLSLLACVYIFELVTNESNLVMIANLYFYYTAIASIFALTVYFWVYFRSYFAEFIFAMLACFIMGFTSANGSFNFSFLVPAITLAIILTLKKNSPFLLKTTTAALLACLCFYNAHSFYHFVYRDETPATALSTEVETGPFKGLYTSKEKHEYLMVIQNSLNKYLTPEIKSIAFVEDFPAGYLMTTRQAKTRAIWMSPDPRIDRNIFLSPYKTTQDLPDLVYIINDGFYTIGIHQSYQTNEPVRNLFATLIQKGVYSSYQVSPTQWILVKQPAFAK